MCCSASSIGIGVAERVAGPDERSRPPARSRAARLALTSGSDAPTPASTARSGAGPACRSARSTRRGRDTRSARTCSWAAAARRAGTCCRRSSRGTSTRRSPCSRRSPPAASIATVGLRHEQRLDVFLLNAPRRVLAQQLADAPTAGPPTRAGPSAISPFNDGARHASPHDRRSSSNRPRSAATEQIEHLVADRHADAWRSASSARRKTPNGRFWIGKSQPAIVGRRHPAAQLGSWVSLTAIADGSLITQWLDERGTIGTGPVRLHSALARQSAVAATRSDSTPASSISSACRLT